MSSVHVVPVDDVIEHDTATGDADCVCGPAVQPHRHEDGSINWLLLQHSLDVRERCE